MGSETRKGYEITGGEGRWFVKRPDGTFLKAVDEDTGVLSDPGVFAGRLFARSAVDLDLHFRDGGDTENPPKDTGQDLEADGTTGTDADTEERASGDGFPDPDQEDEQEGPEAMENQTETPKTETPEAARTIMGPGGAAFLRMVLTDVHGRVKSTGTLASGPGTLVPRMALSFRGEASPALKALLQTAAGPAAKIPLMARKLTLQFLSDKSTIKSNGKTTVQVVAGEDANSAASLVVAVSLDRDAAEKGLDLGDLWNHLGDSGTVILTPVEDEDQGTLDLEPGAVAPMVTIHAPGLPIVETNSADLEDEVERVIADLHELQKNKAAGLSSTTGKAAKVRRRKGGKASPV